MKDTNDTITTELFPVPKKRGRPSTGKAKTAAQRQADYRSKKRRQGANGQLNLNVWVAADAKWALERLARHKKRSPEEILRLLVAAEEQRIIGGFEYQSDEWKHYYRDFE